MASTWVQIRHAFSAFLGDLTKGTATAGAVTSLTDAVARTEATDYWKRASIKVYAGLGIGGKRFIANSTSAGLLTIAGSNWTAPDATSLYELHRYFTADEYDDFLVNARRHLDNTRRLLDSIVDISLTWVTDQYDYTVPANVLGIESIEFSTETGAPDSDEYDFVAFDRWHIRLDATKKLVFNRKMGQPASGTVIRIVGFRQFAAMAADTDSFDFDPWPVIYLAALQAAAALISQGPSVHWREFYQLAAARYEEALKQMPDQTPSKVRWTDRT